MAGMALTACIQEVEVREQGKEVAKLIGLIEKNFRLDLWPRLFWMALTSLYRAYVAEKAIRKIMNNCDESCNGGAPCISGLYEEVSSLRNQCIRIREITPRGATGRLFLEAIDRQLDLWDDLVEDISINRDPEIRHLINDVSRVISKG